jgi:hypothetical protein
MSLGAFLVATVHLSTALSRRDDDAATYRRARWYRTLSNNLEYQIESLDRIGRTNGNLVDGALRSADAKLFDPGIVESMRSFLTATVHLTIAAEKLNRCVTDAMEAELDMKAQRGGGGGFSVAPPEVADESLYDSWRRQFSRSTAANIIVNRYAPSMVTYGVGTIRLPAGDRDRAALLATIDAFQQRVVGSAERNQFLAARTRARAAAGALLVTLERNRGEREDRRPAAAVLAIVTIVVTIAAAAVAALGSMSRREIKLGPWEYID